jgi:hypothetical protein
MRNIAFTTTSSTEGLTKAGKGLNYEIKDDSGNKIPNPKYEAFHANEENLKTAYQNYDAHTQPCMLHEITPMPFSKYHRGGLKELYGRQRPFIKELWDEVAYENGEYIMCPLCGQKIVADLDHYIPRALMPEYSVHLLNLIPTCHECNDDKGDLWLDEGGKRIIFNAYFDKIADMSVLLKSQIIIDADTNYPRVVVSFDDNAIMAAGEVGMLVKLTYKNIESIREQWRVKATTVLKTQIRQIQSTVKVRKAYGCFEEDVWDFEKETIRETITKLQPYEFIEKVVYENMLDSMEFNNWIIGIIKDL